MESWISRDEDSRKTTEGGKFNLRAQKLFGIIKDIFRRLNLPKPTTVFPAYETIKMLKDYQLEFEKRKSEALAYLYQFAHIQNSRVI